MKLLNRTSSWKLMKMHELFNNLKLNIEDLFIQRNIQHLVYFQNVLGHTKLLFTFKTLETKNAHHFKI